MKDQYEKKKGFVPCMYRVCMMCKKIFGDAKYSNKGGFSHGLCDSEKCKEALENYAYKDI
jgi:hypothetical protein